MNSATISEIQLNSCEILFDKQNSKQNFDFDVEVGVGVCDNA